MIGRLAMVLKLHFRMRVALAFAVLLGVATLCVSAQPPQKDLEEQSLIPPERLKDDPARFQINRDLLIFTGLRDPKTGVTKGGIEDDRPLTSLDDLALREVAMHAAKFPAADLADAGRRDLTPDDLTYSARFQFRLDLVRFEGKVVKARRLQPTQSLTDAGLKDWIEARFVPDEESPGYPLVVLLSSWPEGMPPLPPLAPGEPASEFVTIDKWAAVGGFFFKLMTYPGPGANPAKPTSAGWLKAPLLIGNSVVPMPEPAPKIALDKSLRVIRDIKDDTFIPASREQWEQYSAWNRFILHTRKFSAEQLEAEASRKVPFDELYENHKDYRTDLIRFEGQLVRLIEGKTEKPLDAGSIPWYEGWIIPNGEPSGNPISIAILDLPPGLEPGKSMDVPVTFAGYHFKRRRYETGVKDKDGKYVQKLAPFLIGRTVTVKRPTDDTTKFWTEGFVPAVVGGVVLIGGLALTLGWWFRRGDRATQAEIEANRHRNPFQNAN